MKRPRTTASTNPVRCAIYTRKSTEEGLEQEFNTLDAQREAGEAYIRSQQHEGWTLIPERFDDGGFTGGNMDRPALQRLMRDIEAGHIDCVVVYKVDRLSRSLLDFARMMETFEKFRVSFVSVTQQFNTASSMGRLVLNVLLSFAQFEREIISERTRDKIAATRRKGKWTGGYPILGYDVDRTRRALIVNPDEERQVQAIFELYLEQGSLLPVVQELTRRGWVNKRWTTHTGSLRGGQPFTRTSLYKLLTNVLYTGQVRYQNELYPGEHPAIIEPELWQRVQSQLLRHGRAGGRVIRGTTARLKGLIRCVPCNAAMTSTYTQRGNKRYHYYCCSAAQKKGWATCPSKAVPAHAIETLVENHLARLGQDPDMQQAVSEILPRQVAQGRREIEEERDRLQRERDRLIRNTRASRSGPERLATLERQIDKLDTQLAEEPESYDQESCRILLSRFTPLVETLTPREQTRLMHLLIERVDYDGQKGQLAITFRSMTSKEPLTLESQA